MEESVALDTSKQKEFVKSVKGIKKILKKKKESKQVNDKVEEKVVEKVTEKEVIKSPHKRVKHGKVKKRSTRGLVYLSHIPHGFYENEMSQYFRQFGMVTNVRVIRSKRTGNSKGFAFVEFSDPTVAQVVAETMNNYLMGKRLLKAVYIPPSKQKLNAKRMHWTPENNPTANRRKAEKKKINAPKSEETEHKAARNMLKTLQQTKRKLKDIGIDYDFFKPVDVPEGLEIKDISETDEKKVDIKKEDGNDDKKKVIEDKKLDVKKSKKKPKDNKVDMKSSNDTDNTNTKRKLDIKTKNDIDKKKSKVTIEIEDKKGKQTQEVKKEVKKVKTESSDESQKAKKQKLEDMKIELLEDFINIQESDGDSDGSLEFDSDEFEKAMGEESFDSEDNSSDESSVNEEPPKKIVNEGKLRKNKKKQASKQENKETKKLGKPVVAQKRKGEQKPVQPKKVKFEKQNTKKTINKVIKKKK